MILLKEKKSAFNALLVHVVLVACYLPNFCTEMLINDALKIPVLVALQVSLFLVFLNSTLTPVVHCWRYREIREIVTKGGELARVRSLTLLLYNILKIVVVITNF